MTDNKTNKEIPKWKTLTKNETHNDLELSDSEVIMLYRNSCEDMGTGITPICNLEEWIKKQLTITNTITVTNNSGKNVWIYISPKKIPQLKKFEISKLGAIEFTDDIDTIVQKYMFIPKAKKQFILDSPIIYYSIIFYVNGCHICVCENIQIDSRMYDININYKHSVTAINIYNIT